MRVPSPTLSRLPSVPLITPDIVVEAPLPSVKVLAPSDTVVPDTALIDPIVSELNKVSAAPDVLRLTATALSKA